MADTPAQLPESLQKLVDHLKLSGTGQAKIDKITDIAINSDSKETFLTTLKEEIQPVTLKKITDFLDAQEVAAPVKTKADKEDKNKDK